MPTRKIRDCAECGEAFDAGSDGRPAEVCGEDCRKIRAARHTRNYNRRQRAEYNRLRSIVRQMQEVIAA